MSQHDIFERILTSMHEAALRDGGWTAISALVDEACGTKGSNISFCEVYADAEAEVFFARACYRGQRNTELERLYFDNYYEHDERRPGMRRSPHGQLVHVEDLFSERQKKTSALYNEGLPVADFQDSLNVRLDGPNGSRIFRALADPVDSHGWTPDRVASIKRILPHLGQYVAVRQALVDARALDTSLTKPLDNTLSGIAQLDCRRRILAANDRALEMLRRGDGLSDEDGCLRARAPPMTNSSRSWPTPSRPTAARPSRVRCPYRARAPCRRSSCASTPWARRTGLTPPWRRRARAGLRSRQPDKRPAAAGGGGGAWADADGGPDTNAARGREERA